MSACRGIVLIDYVTAQLLNSMTDSLASFRSPLRNSDITRATAQVIAHDSAILSRSVDDLDEGLCCFALIGIRVR
jgi:hypothetical protein